jgi:large subunit ribosomal protein L24
MNLKMAKTTQTPQNSLPVMLSPELIKEYGIRSLPVRKGDTVIPMRGNFRDVEGKVTKVDHKKNSIHIEGVVREKSDGTTIFLPIHPSKVKITKLNLDDKRRKNILERKTSKSTKKIVNKPQTRIRKKQSKNPTLDVKENKNEAI